MSKRFVIISVIVLIIVVGITLFLFKPIKKGGSPRSDLSNMDSSLKLSFPQDCSDEMIKRVWGSIFKEDFTNSVVNYYDGSQDACDMYVVYKKVGEFYFVTYGNNEAVQNTSDNLSLKIITAVKVKANDYLEREISQEAENIKSNDALAKLFFSTTILMPPAGAAEYDRSPRVSSPNLARKEFQSIFLNTNTSEDDENIWSDRMMLSNLNIVGTDYFGFEREVNVPENQKEIILRGGVVYKDLNQSSFYYIQRSSK